MVRDQMLMLISEFLDVFGEGDNPGRIYVVQHRIDTDDYPPVRQPTRRIPLHYQLQLGSLIEDMLNKNIVVPSFSPIVPVKEKDSSLRMCIDYRELNAVKNLTPFRSLASMPPLTH